ncbi:hypothetical protein L227DRAFT_610918 [Lentinus tigrinus ALCF2SS1-6]|uniref:F-box domain-containing protein n=1 Tax=Lentinus tigrinus ALCF2SS1-6 TaxID=1328759 RepID=A0A5C2SC15_9APHY|nr:hypothetical protein L227DRAFT_610918 [Lentinus tigrinus ALCF2SS1-6]
MSAFPERTAVLYPFSLAVKKDVRAAPPRITQYAHHALFEYDVLSMIFDMLDLQDQRDRATCARSARVCRAWTEPASRVLWNGTRWRLRELCTVLLQHAEGPGTVRRGSAMNKIFKSGGLRRNDAQRESLLRCGARVRDLRITQMLQPSQAELRLLQRVLSMSHGTTFLPALLSLSWVEGPLTKALLLRLVPSSLQELELVLDSDTLLKQVHQMLMGLSKSAPSLRSVRIYAWKSELFLLEPLLNISSMRELSLKGDISVGPTELSKILSSLPLVSIEATIRDFSTWTEAINGGSLKELHGVGTCADLTALLMHLRAPNLKTIGLNLNIVDAHFDETTHQHLSQTLLRFALTLRSLQLNYQKVFASVRLSANPSPIALVPDVLAPLFGRLDLERFTLKSQVRVSLTDEHILQLARGWPTLRWLSLMIYPCESALIPTPAALVHLAKHCPELQFLRVQLYARQFVPPPPSHLQSLRARERPLRTLRQMNQVDSCWTRWWTAEFLDSLFPYLAVNTCEEGFDWFTHDGGYSWATVWHALRIIQATRRPVEELRLETW